MTDDIRKHYESVGVNTVVQPQRRWTAEEKIRIVE